ncbi:proton-associated sugar transporter A-like [Lineus longissimus]|uniref:proton-associated sugar transporter A-like n=1 Tax=Lineus longissimus TaxID=88925 RepID=UPI002B4D79E4
MAISIFSTPRQAMATLAKYSQEQVDRMVKTSERKYAETFCPLGVGASLKRPKTRWELLRLCAAVAGIEFAYAAETAFVSPILLRLHVPVILMTFAWVLSPLLGLVLNPLLGSMSDRCRVKMGRRRPFILGLTLGVIFGLFLVPNGQVIGQKFGDDCDPFGGDMNSSLSNQSFDFISTTGLFPNISFPAPTNETIISEDPLFISKEKLCTAGILITIIGVMILDFSCDASQSPCRTYLLDVCIPEDHSKGLSSFTVISGIGGFFGYIIGGIHWGSYIGQPSFMDHVRIVFAVAVLLHLVCVFLTVSSFSEVSLDEITGSAQRHQADVKKAADGKYHKFTNEEDCEELGDSTVQGSFQLEKYNTEPENTQRQEKIENSSDYEEGKQDANHVVDYGTSQSNIDETEGNVGNGYQSFGNELDGNIEIEGLSQVDQSRQQDISLKTYLLSILYLPKSIFWLCLTNLFSWMAMLCYSLYFTDYVGQAVYGGDPTEPEGSAAHDAYTSGVRLGSLAMSLYSLSCSAYSLVIEKLVKKLGARPVYICGHLIASLGTAVMAFSNHPVAVIMCSPTVGIIYATLFTMPYILLAHYHDQNVFDELLPTKTKKPVEIRGLGTDVAVVSSMVFVGQVVLSCGMGSLVHVTGSTVTIVWSSAVLSLIGSLVACKVMYLDL